ERQQNRREQDRKGPPKQPGPHHHPTIGGTGFPFAIRDIGVGRRTERQREPEEDAVKKVLVGMDGSRTSTAAAAWAARLAVATDAEFVAVTAWEPDQAELAPETLDDLRSEALAELDRWCAPIRAGGVRLRTEIREGEPR